MTPLQVHLDKWAKGCGSLLCAGALNICLGRGDIPCDVAFVGEGPGDSEDVLGQPFRGPAGFRMDYIIERALGSKFSYALMNLVGCVPRYEETGPKATAPEHADIQKCKPRLEELLTLANPKLVVAVGAVASKYLEPGLKDSVKVPLGVAYAEIIHPAFILRKNTVVQGQLTNNCIVAIKTALRRIK